MIRKSLLVGLALAALLAGACGGDDDDGEAASDGGGAESVTLTAENTAFDPTSLSVASGGSIEFTNNDDIEHNFTAEDAGLDEDVDGGESVTIDLSDVDPGTYDFFCEYHPDQMTGTLEVTE